MRNRLEKIAGKFDLSKNYVYPSRSNICFPLDVLNSNNNAKFDGQMSLPGSLLNNYILWSTNLVTDDPVLECSGLCLFHDPDPKECQLAVTNLQTSTCFMGTFNADGDGIANKLSESVNFESHFVVSK